MQIVKTIPIVTCLLELLIFHNLAKKWSTEKFPTPKRQIEFLLQYEKDIETVLLHWDELFWSVLHGRGCDTGVFVAQGVSQRAG